MNITIRKLVESDTALKELSELKVKAKISLSIALMLKQVVPIVSLYQDTYNKRLAEVGTPVKEKPGNFTFSPEVGAELQKELDETLDKEVSLDIQKLSIDALGDVPISPGALRLLDWYINLV